MQWDSGLGYLLMPLLAAYEQARTLKFGSTAKVLATCKLKFYRISEWHALPLILEDRQCLALPGAAKAVFCGSAGERRGPAQHSVP